MTTRPRIVQGLAGEHPTAVSRRTARTNFALTLTGLAVLAWLPLQLSPFINEILTSMLVLAIAILSVNLITGFAGQVTVAQGVFVGLGAYTTMLLISRQHWPDLLALAAATVLCLIVGLILGVPALRIKGMYLTLMTLAMAVVFPTLLNHFTTLTGGSEGTSMAPYASPISSLTPDRWCYYLALAGVIVAFTLVRNLVRSRIGRALIATRESEPAGRAYGVAVNAYKVAAFGIGAMVAGFAGALLMLTQQFPFVDPATFTLTYSVNLLVGAVLGGVTSILGPFLGAAFVDRGTNFVQSTLGLNPVLAPVGFGLVLMLLIVVAPSGAAGLLTKLSLAVRRRLWGDGATAAESQAGSESGDASPVGIGAAWKPSQSIKER